MKLKETYALIVFLLLFPFLAVSSVSAQSMCDCNGNSGITCEVLVSSQADLDALALENCTTIAGSLAITSPDLTNLNGLESIESINYDLIIYNNVSLADLDGLTNLRLVGFDLKIIQNDVLASIAGLDNLIAITGDSIEIIWNPGLDDLTPLYGTNVIGNYLVIQNNQILPMINAFQLLIQLSPPNGIFNGSSLITDNGEGVPPPVDSDNDGILDVDDNCPGTWNPVQRDTDGDSIGSWCDACPLDADNDADSDGICGDVDNCPVKCNLNQLDADGDDIGDVCDVTPFCGGCGEDICETEC
jgi:hypothetical protein